MTQFLLNGDFGERKSLLRSNGAGNGTSRKSDVDFPESDLTKEHDDEEQATTGSLPLLQCA